MQNLINSSLSEENMISSLLTLAENTDRYIRIFDLQNGSEFLSNSVKAFLGIDEEKESRHFVDFVLEEDLPIFNSALRRCKESRSHSARLTYRISTYDKKEVYVRENCMVGRTDEEGNPITLVSMFWSLSDDVKIFSDSVLERKTREYFRQLINSASFELDIADMFIRFSTDSTFELTSGLNEHSCHFDEIRESLYEGDFDRLKTEFIAYLKSPVDVFSCVVRYKVDEEETYKWINIIATISEYSDDGTPAVARGYFSNIDSSVNDMMGTHDVQKQPISVSNESDIDNVIKSIDTNRLLINTLSENNPQVNLLFDDNINIVNCNISALTRIKWTKTKAQYISGFRDIFADMKMTVVGSEHTLEEKIRETFVTGKENFTISIEVDGTLQYYSVTAKRILFMGANNVVSYFDEITEHIRTKNQIRHHEEYLHAVNMVAETLMEVHQTDFAYILRSAMKSLAAPIDSRRISLWKNETSYDGKLLARKIYTWVDGFEFDDPMYESDKIIFFDYEKNNPDWLDPNKPKKDYYCGKADLIMDLSTEQEIYDDSDVLFIPLNVHGEFWGLIAFIYNKEKYSQNTIERDVLHSGGMLLASAVIQNEATQSLIEARETALDSIKAKNDFLSRMSHEIRTPMNAIIGMTILARKSKSDIETKQYLDKIEISSTQLLNLINDILDMSKIDAEKMEITNVPFDFERMLENVVGVSSIKSTEKNITVNVNLERVYDNYLVSDELRITQVLTNLISNAVKFTPENGSVTIKVREDEFEGESILVLEVIDTGIGINPKMHDKIFTAFEQGDGGITRKYGGTGLGLSITKKIVDLMNGKISVNSFEGYGSTFKVELPVKWGTRIKRTISQKPINTSLRVLVVDDKPDVTEYFRNIITNFGLECDTAFSGTRAIDMVKNAIDEGHGYDIIFLDWYMPHMSGQQTANEISSIVSDEVFVILISVADWIEIQDDASSAGIRHHLSKPVFPQKIRETLINITNDNMPSVASAEVFDFTRDWSGYNLLLVEDNELNRDIIIGVLADTKINIDCAVDGKEGVRIYRNNPEKYSLIFMDVQMPVLDGLSATRLIRSSNTKTSKQIPIIAMTANAFKEDREKCLEAGMSDYVAKPFNIQDLFDKIDNALEEYTNKTSG